MSQHLLITGAAGFLGRNICEVLGQDYTIRGLDVVASDVVEDFVVGSVTDTALLDRACDGIDAMVIAHMLPSGAENYASVTRPFEVNVTGTGLLFEAAVRAGIRRVVLISSISVVNGQNAAGEFLSVDLPVTPDGIYPLTKALQEEVARYFHRKHGLQIAMLRPAYIAREDSLADKYGIKRPTVNWQFTDPRDIGRAVGCALRVPDMACEAFFVACGPHVDSRVDVARTRERLGWEPLHTFSQYPEDA